MNLEMERYITSSERFGVCFDLYGHATEVADLVSHCLQPFFRVAAGPNDGAIQVSYRVIHGTARAPLMQVDHKRRRMTCAGQTPIITAYTILRFIRSLTMSLAEHHGCFGFHSACVAIGDHGVLITGGKFAGKTTTLMAVLASGQAAFVSNDHVSIDSTGVAHGWPIAVGVRPGTVRLTPVLDHYVRTGSGLYPFVDRELWARYPHFSDGEASACRRKLEFEINELCGLFGVPVRAAATVKLIVVPEYTPGLAQPVIRRIEGDEALAVLRPQVRAGAMPPEGWPCPGPSCTPEPVLRQLVQTVPVVVLTHSEHTLNATAAVLASCLLPHG